MNRELTELTKKKFIEEIRKSGGYSINSILGMSVDEVAKELDTIPEDKAIKHSTYRALYCEEKSHEGLIAYKECGGTDGRDFKGHNRYFKYGNYLLHENRITRESKPIIMINI